MPKVRIIGSGRGGLSMAGALAGSAFEVVEVLGHNDPTESAAVGVDLVLIATPDDVISDVAMAVASQEHTVVSHMSGSLGLDVLAPHQLRAAIHPLVALPDAATGARRLRGHAWFAVAGDHIALDLVEELGGRPFEVSDEHRAEYHAAAVIASNHLVALLGQAERVAALAGVPFEAILDLVRVTVDNVVELGPAAALTGPAARGDEATIRRHLAALDRDEVVAYEALADQARRLSGRSAANPAAEGDRP